MTFTNKVSWAIEPRRCALLIHDMQTHYLGAVPSDQRDQLVRNARAIAAACTDRGIPVFASHVPPGRDRRERGLMLDMWGSGPTDGNDALNPGLGLAGYSIRPLAKRSYSAFFASDFEVTLRRLGRDTLIIVGVYTSIGCHFSAVDAFMRDIRVLLVADATADMNETDHINGLAVAARTCARIVDTDEIIRCLTLPARGLPHSSGRIDVC